MTQQDAYRRLRRVRDRLDAARFAVRYTLDTWDAPRGALGRDDRGALTRTELARTGDDLEPTYVVRLVAAFEAVLRDYRVNGLKKKPTKVDLAPLMDHVAKKRGMTAQALSAAHRVREYRNDVVHRDGAAAALDFAACARALASFLAWLPPHW